MLSSMPQISWSLLDKAGNNGLDLGDKAVV